MPAAPPNDPARRPWQVLVVLALGLGLAACSSLPPRPPLPAQRALPVAHDGVLARQIEPLRRAQPGLSGMLPLETGLEAFAARVWLVERASRGLDLQSYIWRSDRTGRWLLSLLPIEPLL